jgi:hypothetical protein
MFCEETLVVLLKNYVCGMPFTIFIGEQSGRDFQRSVPPEPKTSFPVHFIYQRGGV